MEDSEADRDGESEDNTRCGCLGWTFGERPVDGRSKRGRELALGPLLDAVELGRSDRDILRDPELGVIAFRHSAAYKWAKRVFTAPQNTSTEWAKRRVIIYHGAAGAGKSRRVREECERAGLPLWVAPVGAAGAWYDGFDGHAAALFDDFTGGMSLRDLLNILEGNKVQVPVKGSFVTFAPSVVFFTSDRPWQQWMFKKGPGTDLAPLSQEESAQLGRRITLQEEVRLARTLNEALGMGPEPQAALAPSLVGTDVPTGVGVGGDNTGTPPTPESSELFVGSDNGMPCVTDDLGIPIYEPVFFDLISNE